MASRCRFAPTLFLALAIGLPPLAQANNLARLQSIKQQALALYTLRLADQRQFSPSASLLIGQQGDEIQLTGLSLALDGEMRIQHRYHPSESKLLARGAMQALRLSQLAGGPHDFDITLFWTKANKEQSTRIQRTLRLDDWPRGLSIVLQPNRNGADVSLSTPIDGPGILRSAEYEIAQGRELRALTQMQMLAHVDPALAQSPQGQALQARSLRDWGLERVAQASFSALAENIAASEELKRQAKLEAARLALRNQQSSARTNLPETMTQAWPAADREYAQLLQAQNLLAQGKTDAALNALPSGGSALHHYNIAAHLFNKGEGERGEEILRQLTQRRAANNELDARILDLAHLKLAWNHLSRGQSTSAQNLLGRVRADGPYATRALLGRGWSWLVPLATNNGRLLSVNDDGFRPLHVQAIDAALRHETSAEASKALKLALADWARLQDADPLDPAVQEAQAGTAYALLKLGDYDRAVQYSELLIGRLEAVREHLKDAMRQSRKGLSLNGNALVQGEWPPSPGSWARDFVVGAWWQNAGAKPGIPKNAYRMRLLSQPDTASILEAMHMLNQVEQLMDAVAEHPELKPRATALRKQIEAERAAQQKTMDRNAYYWLRLELDTATKYLILARFSLAQAYAKQDDRPASQEGQQ